MKHGALYRILILGGGALFTTCGGLDVLHVGMSRKAFVGSFWSVPLTLSGLVLPSEKAACSFQAATVRLIQSASPQIKYAALSWPAFSPISNPYPVLAAPVIHQYPTFLPSIYAVNSDTTISLNPSLTQEEPSTAIAKLSNSRCVFLGEHHDSTFDHNEEVLIIKGLRERDLDREMAVGFEMFQQQFQPVLDKYISGEIDENALQVRTHAANNYRVTR